MTMDSARTYLAAFRARFQLMLQYRAAALAGFATQCWWRAIRIMVFAAFYGVHAAAAPISLADAITYVWLGQALLALLPWVADPEVGQAVRTGGVGYDRLRPLDAYGYWYARTLGWMLARALPRAALMLLAAGIVLPLAGLVDIPFRIYFADLRGGAALQGLALQAGWTVVLVSLGRLAMERMMRRLEMQGG